MVRVVLEDRGDRRIMKAVGCFRLTVLFLDLGDGCIMCSLVKIHQALYLLVHIQIRQMMFCIA